MVDDKELQTRVMDELSWKPRVDAAHIGVAVRNGVVSLTGYVSNFAEKEAAERAARRVAGVKAIAEEIEVRLPNAQKHADDEIAERTTKMLSWDVQVPAYGIDVKVEHGVVTLTGKVTSYYQRAAAEADVRRLGGVKGVLNMIRVEPLPRAMGDPEVVQAKIEAALMRNAEIEASRIWVGIADGTATLKGQVRTWFERGAAEEAAWAAPGIRHVKNDITVRP